MSIFDKHFYMAPQLLVLARGLVHNAGHITHLVFENLILHNNLIPRVFYAIYSVSVHNAVILKIYRAWAN